jgi:glutamine synthetase
MMTKFKRSQEESKEYALKMAKEHDVKFIRMWFTDILGMLKSFALPVEELETALRYLTASPLATQGARLSSSHVLRHCKTRRSTF